MKYQAIKTNKYITLNNEVFTYPMSIEARCLLGYMLSKPNGWVFYTNAICEEFKVTQSKLKKLFRELKAFGVMNKRLVQMTGRIEWITEIFESPELNSDYQPPKDDNSIGSSSIGSKRTDSEHTDILIKEITNKEIINKDCNIISKVSKLNNKTNFDFESEINKQDWSPELKEITIDFFKNKELVHKKKVTELIFKQHAKKIANYTEQAMLEATSIAIAKSYQAVFPSEHGKKNAVAGVKEMFGEVVGLLSGEAKTLFKNWFNQDFIKKTDATLVSASYILANKSEEQQRNIILFALQKGRDYLSDFKSNQNQNTYKRYDGTYGYKQMQEDSFLNLETL